MRASHLFRLVIGAGASLVTMACHRSSVVPQSASPPPRANEDSLRLARARADSIARDNARRRDSLLAANARADSLRRDAERARAAETARATLLAPVYFDFDRSEIRASDDALVEQKANILRANAPVRVRVEGNTDERGSDEYNLALGMRRAAQVRRALLMQGVDSARVTIISNGEERSTCRESTETCWSRDRRAEVVIVAGGERITAVNHRP